MIWPAEICNSGFNHLHDNEKMQAFSVMSFNTVYVRMFISLIKKEIPADQVVTLLKAHLGEVMAMPNLFSKGSSQY